MHCVTTSVYYGRDFFLRHPFNVARPSLVDMYSNTLTLTEFSPDLTSLCPTCLEIFGAHYPRSLDVFAKVKAEGYLDLGHRLDYSNDGSLFECRNCKTTWMEGVTIFNDSEYPKSASLSATAPKSAIVRDSLFVPWEDLIDLERSSLKISQVINDALVLKGKCYLKAPEYKQSLKKMMTTCDVDSDFAIEGVLLARKMAVYDAGSRAQIAKSRASGYLVGKKLLSIENHRRDSVAYRYRLEWFDRLAKIASEFDPGYHLADPDESVNGVEWLDLCKKTSICAERKLRFENYEVWIGYDNSGGADFWLSQNGNRFFFQSFDNFAEAPIADEKYPVLAGFLAQIGPARWYEPFVAECRKNVKNCWFSFATLKKEALYQAGEDFRSLYKSFQKIEKRV